MSDIPGLGVGALDHVYHRLVDDCADWITLSPFTVLVDPERIKLLLPEGEDINLPEEIKYLMQLQLEEADLIVLNKIDVMTPEEVERDVAFLREACPDIPVMTISALRGDGIPELAEYLETHESLLKNFSVRDNEKFPGGRKDPHLVQPPSLLQAARRREDRLQRRHRRPHRGDSHGAHRKEAQRPAPQDLRDGWCR